MPASSAAFTTITLSKTRPGACRRPTATLCSLPATPAGAGASSVPCPSKGAWQRGTGRPQVPVSGAVPAAADVAGSIKLKSAAAPLTFVIKARLPPQSYHDALEASLCRETISAAQLLDLAAAPSATLDMGPPRLLEQLLHGPLESYQDTLMPAVPGGCSTAVAALLEQWQLDLPEQPEGFDRRCHLGVPGIAEAAVVSRAGRSKGRWQVANQDAYVACATATPDGASPALLLGVLDGHGRGGDNASQTAAGGLAGAVPAIRNQLLADAACSRNGASAGQQGVSQEALVTAFQAVAGSMRYDCDFQRCGAAAVACLVEKDSITAAWCGDCRAVVGLSVDTPAGPSMLVHSLTQDHKPHRPLERARIQASGKGRVLQLRPSKGHRLCGTALDGTLSLSRAFGDTWALPFGLTAEPDALTLTLPPPAHTILADASRHTCSPGCLLDSLATTTNSSSDSDDGNAPQPSGPARHVLVLGCDGLWDAVGNSDAVAIAMSSSTPKAAALALLHAAQRKWAVTYAGEYMDDITIAVAFLPA